MNNYASFASIASLSSCGEQLPHEAFMAWPTRKPMTVSFHFLYSSTTVGLFPITSAARAAMSKVSTLSNQFFAMIESIVSPVDKSSLITVFA